MSVRHKTTKAGIVWYVETRGQRGVQLRAAHVRVAVHPAGGLDRRLEHARERLVRVLVRGELVRRDPGPRDWRLAGDVGRDGSEGRARCR